jgi:hypothetical protein
MNINEKEAVITTFLKALGLAQKTIEAELDAWLAGSGTEAVDSVLLDIIALSVRLLQISGSKQPIS